MKNKGMLFLLILAATVAVVPFASAQDETDMEQAATILSSAPPPIEVGRYQLFDGQYSVTSLKGPESAEKHLFRLDTVTGTVWIGKQVQYLDKRSGKVIQQRYWEPFEQYLEGQAPQQAGR